MCLHRDRLRTEYYNRSFKVSGTKLWNDLPEALKQRPSLGSFKHAITDYVLAKDQF